MGTEKSYGLGNRGHRIRYRKIEHEKHGKHENWNFITFRVFRVQNELVKVWTPNPVESEIFYVIVYIVNSYVNRYKLNRQLPKFILAEIHRRIILQTK
jgi:hypothetical protein